MWIAAESGGQTHRLGSIMGGAPELVVEVAKSSRFIDLGPKYRDYERTGVREYVVIALDPEQIYWFVSRDRQVRASRPRRRRYLSIPGLPRPLGRTPPPCSAAIIRPCWPCLQRGLATPEHAAFVERLAEARRKKAEG